MSILKRFAFGFRALTRRERLKVELDEELRGFTEMSIEEKTAGGLTEEAAVRQTRLELGDAAAVRDWVGDVGWQAQMYAIGRDLRYACRTLRRSPGMASASIITIGLGIGANAAVFSVMDAVWFRAVPYDVSDRLVMVWNRGGTGSRILPSTLDLLNWKNQEAAFDLLVGVAPQTVQARVNGAAVEANVATVDPAFFSALGESPVIGRLLTEADQASDADGVALISTRFWQQRYGRDPSAVGQIVGLGTGTNIESLTVVGVLPERFNRLITSAIVRPARGLPDTRPGRRPVWVFGVMRPGVSLTQAQSMLQSTAPDAAWEPNVVSVRNSLVGADVGRILGALFAAVGLVLLMACVNVSNLLLARLSVREREMAIRSAIGASRAHLVRQLVVESAVIAGAGAVLGLLVARVTRASLVAIIPPTVRGVEAIAIDARVLGFVLLLAVLCTLAFGVWPAVRLSGIRAERLLPGRETSGGTGGAGGRQLLAAQIGLALMVIIGSAVLLRGFIRLLNVDPGFDPTGVITFRAAIPPPPLLSLQNATPSAYARLTENMLAELQRPEMAGKFAGAIDALPLRGGAATYTMRLDGVESQPADSWVQFHRVTPGYFEAMGIAVRHGRAFNEGDRHGAAEVVMVSDITARRFWPGEDVLGKKVFIGGRGPMTVTGVVGAVRYSSLEQEPKADVYRPWRQDPTAVTFVVRTHNRSLARALHAPNATIGGTQITDVEALDQHVMRSIHLHRFRVVLFGLMGLLVLILAAVGVWGVTAQSVARRTREVGIRMALGAGPARVRGLIVGETAAAVAAGLAVGLIGAYWTSRLLQSFLFETSARDPLAFIVSAAVLGGIAVAAASVPAQRVTRIDPAITLRQE